VCELKIVSGGGAGFFDEAVEQDDGFMLDEKQDPGDAIGQAGAHLPKAGAKRMHQGRLHRPGKLHRENVNADQAPLIFR
jgi:hypothetical protein